MRARTFERAPAILPSYVRALTRRAARSTPVPDVEAVLSGITVDRERLAAYASVCGFAATDPLPATYPHVLAFPLAMALMTDRAFPLPAMGLVHIANRITVHRPIEAGARLDLRVHATAIAPHPSGSAFDIVARLWAGELAWESTSTYLSRGRGSGEKAPRPAEDVGLDEAAVWRLPSNTGRRYAAVSGDRNPIHLYTATARLFGFKRAIAHGMWTKARLLAELAPRLPPAYTVQVSFGSPVLLPATVRLMTGGELEFRLESQDGRRTHLYGTVTALRYGDRALIAGFGEVLALRAALHPRPHHVHQAQRGSPGLLVGCGQGPFGHGIGGADQRMGDRGRLAAQFRVARLGVFGPGVSRLGLQHQLGNGRDDLTPYPSHLAGQRIVQRPGLLVEHGPARAVLGDIGEERQQSAPQAFAR